jgi:hypothetical protein
VQKQQQQLPLAQHVRVQSPARHFAAAHATK